MPANQHGNSAQQCRKAKRADANILIGVFTLEADQHADGKGHRDLERHGFRTKPRYAIRSQSRRFSCCVLSCFLLRLGLSLQKCGKLLLQPSESKTCFLAGLQLFCKL